MIWPSPTSSRIEVDMSAGASRSHYDVSSRDQDNEEQVPVGAIMMSAVQTKTMKNRCQ